MLSGCTTKEFHLGWYDKCLPKVVVKYEKIYPNIAKDRLVCGSMPIPDANITKQSEVAMYITDVVEYGKGCGSNLEFVRDALGRFSDTNTTR